MIGVAAIALLLGSLATLIGRPTFFAMLVAVNLICLSIPVICFVMVGMVSHGLRWRRGRVPPADAPDQPRQETTSIDRED